MTKQLIIGLATLSVAGAALLGSGMYAATTTTDTTSKTSRMEQRDPTAMLATIKSQVSAEAYTALETLMAKHKAAMPTDMSTVDKTTMQAEREAFKTEMDALITQYPELKEAMPQGKMGGERGGKMGGERGGKMGKTNPMEDILSGVTEADKTAIEAIRTEYNTKKEALRTEEKAKIDTIIAKYPELKTQLDTLEANKSERSEGRGGKMGGRGMKNTTSTTDATTAQ